MEGVKVLKNLDLVVTVGPQAAYDVTLLVHVTDGKLNIALRPVVDYAIVSAIVAQANQRHAAEPPRDPPRAAQLPWPGVPPAARFARPRVPSPLHACPRNAPGARRRHRWRPAGMFLALRQTPHPSYPSSLPGPDPGEKEPTP
jgi:hypothetical protein